MGMGMDSLFVKEPPRKRVTTALKKAVLGDKGKQKNEEVHMINSIKRRQKIKSGQVEAIRSLRFTVGTEETNAFETKNVKLAADGLAHFKRMEKGIGQHTQIVVWIEKTIDQDEFITDLQLSHTDPDNEHYKDLKRKGFACVEHENMKGAQVTDPSFRIWLAKNKGSSHAIAEIEVSYTSAEEEDLFRDGWQKLEENMTVFGFGDMHVWLKRMERTSVPQVENTQHILHELKEVRKLAKRSPEDDNLKNMEANLRKRLEKAQVAEDERNMYDDAPVKYSIEFLALNAAEIRKFMDYFEKIDKDHTGFITPDELFAYIGERRCEYGTSLFKMLDSFDADGKLDFGEFMKAVGTFCLFGKEEVTRFTYSVFDEDNSGSITHGELLQLLSDLHPPAARNRVLRALKEIDLQENSKLTYPDFEALSIKFPNLFFPAFRMQDSMRKAFFGVKWWERKLRRYDDVKRSVLTSGQSTDKQAAKEAKKEQQRHERATRRVERRREVRDTKSHVRRVILQVRIFSEILVISKLPGWERAATFPVRPASATPRANSQLLPAPPHAQAQLLADAMY